MVWKKTNSGISPNFVILLTIFVDMTGFGIIIPLLPYYTASFNVGDLAFAILIATFALMQFLFSPILGRLSDRVGRRPVILISILTSIFSFFIFAIATSYAVLLISRIVAGIATEISVAQAYISDITTEKERAGAMGKISAALGAGFIVGPALGGLLGDYGFSGAAYFATGLALINFVLVFLFLPESRKISKNIQEKMQVGFFKGLVIAFSRPTMKLILIILFMSSLALAAFPVLMPLLAISFFDSSSSDLAVFFVYTGFLQIIFQGFLIGRIAKRIDETKMIVIGSVLMAIGFFLKPFSPSYLYLMLIATMPGFGSWLGGTAITSYISKISAPTEQGVNLGVAHSIRSLSNIPGPFIAGFIYEIIGIQEAFFFTAGLMIISTLLGIKLMTNSSNKLNSLNE